MVRENFNVIRITKLDFEGYLNESYFNGFSTDSYGDFTINEVNKPYNAMRIKSVNDRQINALIEFIKTLYPRKNHTIEMIEIELSY